VAVPKIGFIAIRYDKKSEMILCDWGENLRERMMRIVVCEWLDGKCRMVVSVYDRVIMKRISMSNSRH
jgi:hypothetical protein